MRLIELTNSDEVALVSDEDYYRVNARAWRMLPSGYVMANDHDNPRRLGRFILIDEVSPEVEVDHINGILLDCTRDNLRIATRSQNAANISKPVGGTSRFKGVSWSNSKGKWVAQVKKNGKVHYIGQFDNEEDAAIAYDEAALYHFGEFARINGVGKPNNAPS